jgi:hypothetical protein
VRDCSFNLAIPLLANLSEIPTGCGLLKLALVVDVPDVLYHVGARSSEELRKLLLGQPDGIVLQSHLDRWSAILTLIQDDLTAHDAPP